MERIKRTGGSPSVRWTVMVGAAMAAVVMAVAPAMAQNKPDFSGTWNLDSAKSDFGQVPGPSSETIVLTQKSTDLNETVNFTDEQGAHNYTLDLTLDGPEVTFTPDKAPQLGMVTLQKVKAAWQGASVLVNETLKYEEDADVTGTNTYSLSADGNTLTMDMSFSTPMGNMTRKMVFDKAGTGGGTTAAAAVSSASASAVTTSGSSAGASSSAAAGPAPNLSGTWKLDIAKSDFGQIPVPDSRTEQITDAEPNIKIVSSWTGGAMGDGSNTMDLDTTGKETTSQIMGNDAKNTAKWDGASLVVDTTMTMQDADIAVKSTYNVSGDGKTLTVLSHVTGPMGEMDMKAVYEKQ